MRLNQQTSEGQIVDEILASYDRYMDTWTTLRETKQDSYVDHNSMPDRFRNVRRTKIQKK